jgi:solute carrier family 25 protein 46
MKSISKLSRNEYLSSVTKGWPEGAQLTHRSRTGSVYKESRLLGVGAAHHWLQLKPIMSPLTERNLSSRTLPPDYGARIPISIFNSFFRRQGQLQSESSRAYLTPLSAIRMIYTMKYQQGSGVLWKGCFSSLILTTLDTISDNLIDEIAPLNNPSLRIKHILLKTISSFLLIPMYSVHLLRSVQSDLTISNPWSPLTIFIEPFQRLLGIKTGFYARAFPLWYLISLSLPYFVGRHVLQYFLNDQFFKIREENFHRKEQTIILNRNQFETIDDIECQLIDTIPKLVNRSFLRIEATIFSVFLSNFLLYPYETILNRLFVQGTRTIVDNLDKTGVGCIAIIETEGRWGRGFLKGIGFLILKFGLIYASAQCLKLVIERLAIIYTQNTSELSKFHHYVISKQQQEPSQQNLYESN